MSFKRYVIHLEIAFQTRCSLIDPERLRAGIDDFLDKTFLTDACVLYSPSQVNLNLQM